MFETTDPAVNHGIIRAFIAAICTAGRNSNQQTYKSDVIEPADVGLRQADHILESCGLVHPDQT